MGVGGVVGEDLGEEFVVIMIMENVGFVGSAIVDVIVVAWIKLS